MTTPPSDEAGDMDLRLEALKGFSGKLIQAVLGFAGTIVFARVLGPTSFGGFYFLLSLVTISDRPIRGLGQAARKRYSEAGARKGQIVGAVLGANLVFFTIVGVAVFFLEGRLVAATGLAEAGLVFMVLLVSLGLFFPFQQLLGAQGWVSKQTWNDTLRSVFTLGLQLGFVAAGFGAAGMGYGLAGASLLVIPVAWYFLRVRPSLPDGQTIRSLWAYAKHSTPAAFVGKAYDRFDVLLLGAVLTPAAVGYYEVALKLTIPALFLPQVISSGLMPKISNKDSRDEPIAEDVTNAAAYTSLFAVPLAFGAIVLAERIVVTAYGPEYRAAAPLLIGLAVYQVLRSQTQVYRSALGGLDRPDLNLRYDAATLLLNVALGIALVFEIGALGVVVATVIAEGLRLGLTARGLRTLVPEVGIVPRPLVEQVVAGLGMAGAVLGLTAIIRLPTFLHVGAVVSAGGVVYGLLLVILSEGFRVTLLEAVTDMATGTPLERYLPEW